MQGSDSHVASEDPGASVERDDFERDDFERDDPERSCGGVTTTSLLPTQKSPKSMTSPYILENLRNELKSKEKELSAKIKEVELERAAREASERANESKIVHIEELENRILGHEARCNELKHECKTLKNDKRALEASLAKTSAEADRWVVGLVPRSSLAPTLSLSLTRAARFAG